MNSTTIIFSILLLVAPLRADVDFGSLSEKCGINYDGLTQMGEMKIRLSVCELGSDRGYDSSLLVITTHEKEFPPRIEKLLEQAHSPIIEKNGEEIVILYSAGVNTTCVVSFTIMNGYAKFSAEETIAWNDRGVYKTSESFENYAHLLEKKR